MQRQLTGVLYANRIGKGIVEKKRRAGDVSPLFLEVLRNSVSVSETGDSHPPLAKNSHARLPMRRVYRLSLMPIPAETAPIARILDGSGVLPFKTKLDPVPFEGAVKTALVGTVNVPPVSDAVPGPLRPIVPFSNVPPPLKFKFPACTLTVLPF